MGFRPSVRVKDAIDTLCRVGCWRVEYADDENPRKLPNKSERHGTYTAEPYFAFIFIEGDDGGTLHMISDGSLHRLLIPYVDQPDQPSAFSLDAADDDQHRGLAGAKLTVGGGACGDKTDCFTVSGVLGSSPELRNGRYLPMAEAPEDDGLDQTLGSVFAHMAEQFGACLTSYDVTRMTLDNPQNPGGKLNLFATPPSASKKYTKVGDSVVPFGWKRAADDRKYGGIESTVISSGKDLRDASSTTFGFKAGFDLFGLNIGGSQSETDTRMVDHMYEHELTYISHTNVLTRYAYVLDKTNVVLADDLVDGFSQLYRSAREPADFDHFFDNFGTHFAHAVTLGAKGYLISTATKDQVVDLHDESVDIKSAVSVGFSQKFDGMDLGASAEIDSDQAEDHYRKMEHVLGRDLGAYSCIGDCSNGDPTGSTLAPVLLDLRPISDLLAPPFYRSLEIVALRRLLEDHLRRYAFYQVDEGTQASAARFNLVRYQSNDLRLEPGTVPDDVHLGNTTDVPGLWVHTWSAMPPGVREESGERNVPGKGWAAEVALRLRLDRELPFTFGEWDPEPDHPGTSLAFDWRREFPEIAPPQPAADLPEPFYTWTFRAVGDEWIIRGNICRSQNVPDFDLIDDAVANLVTPLPVGLRRGPGPILNENTVWSEVDLTLSPDEFDIAYSLAYSWITDDLFWEGPHYYHLNAVYRAHFSKKSLTSVEALGLDS